MEKLHDVLKLSRSPFDDALVASGSDDGKVREYLHMVGGCPLMGKGVHMESS